VKGVVDVRIECVDDAIGHVQINSESVAEVRLVAKVGRGMPLFLLAKAATRD
jgi:hypothetical protein